MDGGARAPRRLGRGGDPARRVAAVAGAGRAHGPARPRDLRAAGGALGPGARPGGGRTGQGPP